MLRRPLGQLRARRTSEVAAVLTEAEAAARRGNYVAGFVAYEAAPAFDPAFRLPAPGSDGEAPSLPLAWFELFAAAEPAPPLPPVAAPDGGRAGWECEIDADAHLAAVRAIQKAAADGDAYLVNYTTRLRRRWEDDEDPFELYRRLVAGYGGGYHAFIETEEWAVACGSPELFFELSAESLTSRPIKGTASRGRSAAEDLGRARELRASTKERAENVMVVDLLRNDLGRIARPGSVAVPSLGLLEQHPSLWQLTSTVTATPAADLGLADVFAALFPCASVTGAPKVSAMSLIADLERSPRGVYCGAVGLLAPAVRGGLPAARFAVAIRTAVVDKARQVAEYGSGGGITWDSDPGPEWEEVFLKARALDGTPAPLLRPDQGLIETMGYVPGEGRNGVRNLDDHLARLASSARYFGLVVPDGIGDLVAAAVEGLEDPARVRLVLRAGGAVEIETAPLQATCRRVLRLCVDREPVACSDVRLYHKTTDRRLYEERALRHPHADDVVLVNERGEVTETTRANLAVYLDDRWCTPPVHCGLLPGVARARCLAEGRLVERVVSVDDLLRASRVATLSSLRGWREGSVQARCPC